MRLASDFCTALPSSRMQRKNPYKVLVEEHTNQVTSLSAKPLLKYKAIWEMILSM